jgi:hypothetical protein
VRQLSNQLAFVMFDYSSTYHREVFIDHSTLFQPL